MDCTIRVAKTKALISFAVSYREADLRLCFRICKKPVFSRLSRNFRRLSGNCSCAAGMCWAWPKGYKTLFVLNSTEHEIYPAHKR